VGFLTRRVEDGAILLGVLAGSDPQDPTASLEPVPDYLRSCKSLRRPPRIGIIREYYQEKSEEQVWRHTEKVLMQLRKAGAPVEEVKMPPSFAAVQDAQRVIMRVEGASFHQKLLEKQRDQYRPKLRELVEIGLLIPSVDYLRAQKVKRQFRDQMDQVVKNYDCLLTPSVSSPAPPGLSSTGDPHFQAPWSLSGLPAISLPTGLASQGLPLGIQLVGAAFAEGKLFATARWCEKVLRVSLSPPLG
jgi:amidase